MESLLKRIERNRKEHERLIALVLCLSIIVSMGTFAVFHKKAVAKTYIEKVLDCPFAAEGAVQVVHIHNDDCYDENHELVCRLPELEAHTHSDDCYAEVPVQVCGLPESVGHVHGTECRTLMLTCEEEEREATFDEEGNMADPGHIHTPDCYSEVLSCGMEEGDGAHTHTDACYETEYVLACDKPEIRLHVHTDDCYQKNEDGSIYVDEDGCSWLICGMPEVIQHAHGPECFKIYELVDGEPEAAEENKETTDTTDTTDTEDITVPALPMPAQSWERTAGGIKVSVEAPEGAFPENTRIAVTPVNGSSLMDTVSDAVNGEVLEVQAVDITFFDAEGREIEPAVPIRVVMTPAATEHAEEKTNVVHIDLAQQTAEVIEQAEGTETDNSEVVFDAEAFTIYAIVYTVHFEYEVNGQVYTSTVPGAQDKLLSELIRELNVVNEEQLPEFMTKIREVSFSNPEVLIITETEGDWIIRALKDCDQEESLTIVMQDGATFRITVEAEGITEVSDENEVATVSTVNDLYLPASSEVKAELLTEEQSGNAIAAVQTAAESDGSGAATYQAFSIALENVDVTAYDGFNVAVALPEEAVVGRDFQLYQVREDGTAIDLTESLTVTSEKNEEGLQNVSSISFTTEDFADFVLSYSIETYYTTADGDRYKITLNYGSKAEIPDGAELKVREILPEDETYSNYLDDSAAKLGVNSGDVSFARFFDIEIRKDNEKIEPKAPVQVTISLADTPEETVPAGLKVVHFAETGLETIDGAQAEQKEDATIDLSFETSGFSVYGVVYTVDFHNEINGKTYEFSIPGGGFISLEHIVEALGLGTDTNALQEAAPAEESDAESAAIAENGASYDEAIKLNEIVVSNATRTFVADVVNVEFSSPELVWVGKVDEAVTVGGLKEANGLEVEYSANLTEEQIAEINAQTVEAGDWALISVHPFLSEESLTVTMKNGDQWTVKVTDAQLFTYVVTADGETYIITVTYGPEAGIPANATLEAREILEGTEEYAEYLAKSRTALIRSDAEAAASADGSEAAADAEKELAPEPEDPLAIDAGAPQEIGGTDDGKGVILRAQATAVQDIVSARFFDLTIMANGEEVEPLAPVSVTIRYVEPVELDGTQSVQVVHFGDESEVIEPEVSGKTDEAVDTFDFKASSFSVYGVLARFVTDADRGEFTVAGEDFSIRIVYGPEAQIPVGTELTVRELDPESDEYIQRLGQAWYEVNREYFEVEEMRAHYDEGMGDLPDLHLVNLDAARFFDISFEYDGEEIEPGNAVQVEIRYDEGLKALGDCVPVSGVAHFAEAAVELLENVEIETDKNGGIVSFKYEQTSFSDTGTYVGQETFDARTPQYMAPAPVYDPSQAITLSSLGATGLLGPGEGNGNSVTSALAGSSSTALPSPASSKTLTPNRDGTYTLNLSVAGSSRSTNTAEVNRSNVLIVMDRSSSMINNKVKTYTAYNGNYQSGTTYYGKEGDGYFPIYYNNRRYYRTRTGNSWNYQYSDQYIGQVYTATDGDRRLDAEQAALSSLISQLLAKNNEFKQDSEGYLLDDNNDRVLDENNQPIKVNDVIEISVISFADQRLDHNFTYPQNIGGYHSKEDTEVDWTTDYNALIDNGANPKGVMSDFAPSGTNWEDALQYAKEVADAKHSAQPDEPMFVLFLTDGEPTAYAGEFYNCYNDNTGAHHYINTNGTTRGGFIEAYTPAKDDAQALVTSGYEFYGIFTYGEGAEQVGYLRRLVNVAYGHADDTTQTEDLTEHFHDAGDNDALLSAFEHILSKISGTIAVGNVTVADGLTTDATATTLVNGQADGFRYSVTGPVGELYSVTASGSDSNPTVTFTINGQNIPGEKKTEHVTRNQVDGNGKPIPDQNNPGKYLTVTEDKTYYSATVGNTEYKMALASIEDGGQITWDLSAVGTLMDGYSYNCSFVVWPDQEAYDYVAGLNNGLNGYEWNQDAATAVRDENDRVIYYTGGVSEYPSIVKYPNGIFSVLTNTNQSVTYSIVDTKTDETTGEIETTYDGPYTKPLEYPDPMDLTGSSLSITKAWDDSMDPQQLKDVVDDYASNHPGEMYSITLTMYENGVKYKDYTFYPVWDTSKNCYTWKSADFSIAPALLVSKHPGGSKTYKTVTLGGVTYYVLNDGHEYTLDEEVVDYHFEFSADSYHPALVDGKLYNVQFSVDDNGHIVSGSTATLRGDTLETFTGTNTLKGRLYVEKETVVPADTIGVDLNSLTFDVKITLTDREGALISSPKDENGNYDAESGLMYRIHYGKYNPQGTDFDPAYGNYGRSDKMAVENGVITETIYAEDVIYVGNMPVGTHYVVEETSMPPGWKEVGIVAKNEDGAVDSAQLIYGNKADYVTITNTLPSFDVNIFKTSEGGQRPLGGAYFKLYGTDYYVTDNNGNKVVNENATLVLDNLVSDTSTGLIKLGQLGGGEYYLVETAAPEGYLPITEPIRIVVNGASTQTKNYDNEPTTRPLYVTYTQSGNSLSENNEGVAIDATPLTDGDGAPMVDENDNTVYNYSYTLTVTNNAGVELPQTGGIGTTLFTALGGLMTATAGVILAMTSSRRKRKPAEG